MTHAADIEAQAAAWLMKRDATGENAEAPEFTAWLAADPRHRAAYLRLAAAWERSARLKRMRPDGAAVDPDLLMPAGTRSRWGDRRMPLTLAAGVVAAAVVAAIWWMGTPEVPTYRTDVGGLSRMVLRDGSTVTLNTDTELRVRLSDSRQSRHSSGERDGSLAPTRMANRGALVPGRDFVGGRCRVQSLQPQKA